MTTPIMRTNHAALVLVLSAILVAWSSSAAVAADAASEIGTSLVSGTIGLGKDSGSTLGIPSSGFDIVNPDVYVSFFVGHQLAIEPRLGLIVASTEGQSNHLLNLAGQVDYFVKSNGEESPYLFASLGLLHASLAGTTPKSVSGGAGYRVLVGRLTFRFDGRITHFTDGIGNSVGLSVSIGGTFGQRK